MHSVLGGAEPGPGHLQRGAGLRGPSAGPAVWNGEVGAAEGEVGAELRFGAACGCVWCNRSHS